MAQDLRDYGFKTGDTMRATHPHGRERVGTVGWYPHLGMTLEWSPSVVNYTSSLTRLHDLGWTFELMHRPLLDDTQRAIANILDDPSLHFAFRHTTTEATAYTERTMAAVGIHYPVMVLPSAVREQFEANAPAPIKLYQGKLPGE